jgi:hypothetical protein
MGVVSTATSVGIATSAGCVCASMSSGMGTAMAACVDGDVAGCVRRSMDMDVRGVAADVDAVPATSVTMHVDMEETDVQRTYTHEQPVY